MQTFRYEGDMKTIVIYDSQFGNTAQIAERIGDGLRDAQQAPEAVEVIRVGDVHLSQVGEGDLVIVGSPTQKFNPTPAIRAFLKGIPGDRLLNVKVAAFDTRLSEGKMREMSALLGWMVRIFGYAAAPIAKQLERRGGTLVLPPQGFYVEDMEGPLLEGELERAAAWVEQIIE